VIILTIGVIIGSFRNNLTTGRKIMDKKGEFTKNGTPLFDGKNYAFWSIRMRYLLQAHGFDVRQFVVNGYTVPVTIFSPNR
jgi:hypothetical protein